MTYSLQVVQLCPDAHRDVANAIAEALGHGPNNLSRKLLAADGSVWWGCCAWWKPDQLMAQLALEPLDPETGEPVPGAAEALAAVVTVPLGQEDGPASWDEALASQGLAPMAEPDDH